MQRRRKADAVLRQPRLHVREGGDRRGEIDVRDERRVDAGKRPRRSDREREPDRRLVRIPLADQTVEPELVPVVGEEHDHGPFEHVVPSERVALGGRHGRERCDVIRLAPHVVHLRERRHRRGYARRCLAIACRGDPRCVWRVRREIQEPGTIGRGALQERVGGSGEHVGRVRRGGCTVVADVSSIDDVVVVIRGRLARALLREPAIPTRWNERRAPPRVAVEVLPDQRRRVSGLVQPHGKRVGVIEQGAARVVADVGPRVVPAGEDRRTGRAAERR